MFNTTTWLATELGDNCNLTPHQFRGYVKTNLLKIKEKYLVDLFIGHSVGAVDGAYIKEIKYLELIKSVEDKLNEDLQR